MPMINLSRSQGRSYAEALEERAREEAHLAAEKAAQPPREPTPDDEQVTCRVRPCNFYAGVTAGDTVTVTAREYRRCKHALISLADEQREAAEAAAGAQRVSDEAERRRRVWENLRRSFTSVRELGEQVFRKREAERRIAVDAEIKTLKGTR